VNDLSEEVFDPVDQLNSSKRKRLPGSVLRVFAGKRVRSTAKWLFAVLIILLIPIIFHNRILDGIGCFMAVRDPIQKADLILVMDDEGHTSPQAVADLYARGYAPTVVIPRLRLTRVEQLNITLHRHDLWRKVLGYGNVPTDKVIFLGEELKDSTAVGRALGEYTRSNNIKSVIVVTSPSFSRLTRNGLLKGLSGQPLNIMMYPVRTRYFDEHDWWHTRQGVLSYFDAYLLWTLRRVQ
jgi:hypothetical protein